MTTKSWFLAVIIATTLGNCSRGGDFYPMTEGYHWVYEVRNEDSSDESKSELSITAMTPQELSGHDVVPFKLVRPGGTSFLFQGKDEHGVFSIARQQSQDEEPDLYDSKRYFIGYPPAAGKTWVTAQSSRYGEIFYEHIECSIVSVDQAVTTPYGTFEHCLRVDCEGSDIADIGAFKYTSSFWFSQGVGFVKAIVREGEAEALGSTIYQTHYQLIDFVSK